MTRLEATLTIRPSNLGLFSITFSAFLLRLPSSASSFSPIASLCLRDVSVRLCAIRLQQQRCALVIITALVIVVIVACCSSLAARRLLLCACSCPVLPALLPAACCLLPWSLPRRRESTTADECPSRLAVANIGHTRRDWEGGGLLAVAERLHRVARRSPNVYLKSLERSSPALALHALHALHAAYPLSRCRRCCCRYRRCCGCDGRLHTCELLACTDFELTMRTGRIHQSMIF